MEDMRAGEARRTLDPRRRDLWLMHDFSHGRGLEVGPLHDPLVRRDEADVRYADVLDRNGLREHYKDHAAIPIDNIPEIDYPLIRSGVTHTLVEVAGCDGPFDWAVASHVIEHVPDIIGWLNELADLVRDDGALVLIVPDRRYCFDLHRPPTTVGQMIEANVTRALQPGPRAVYDHFRSAVRVDAADAWRGTVPTYSDRIHSMEEARAKAELASQGEYVDCHVWMFTPDGFAEQMQELRLLGLSRWVLERMDSTRPGELEFKVLLRKRDGTEESDAARQSESCASDQRPEWLRELETARTRIDKLERRLATQRRRVVRLKARLEQKGLVIERLRAELGRGRREHGRDHSGSS